MSITGLRLERISTDRSGFEQHTMGNLDRDHVTAHDDDTHPNLGKVKELLGECMRHPDATVRRRISRQFSGMECDA